tara:strand:- start:2218 stop:2733 length:516 start_codon:yes stop_codon:yes gene_type:complete
MNDPKQNFNWCVEQSQIIHCKRSKLWKTISSESNLELFHPFCKTNNIIIWPGDKSEDILVYLNGRTMRRKFIFWENNFGYDLFINQMGFESSLVSWRIKDENEGSRITISVWPYLFNKGNKVFNWFPFKFFVHPSLEKYLSSVLRGLKYYLENDKKIKKNQFGLHRWFSNY